MGINVTVEGYQWLKVKGPRMSRDVKESMVDEIHHEFHGLEVAMVATASGYGRIQQIAARTVHGRYDTNGANIHGGGGRGLPGILFAGSEFGGRRRRRSYISRRGRELYLIERRRVTMMFYPYAGHRGYFYFPAIRRMTPGLADRMADAMMRGVRK